MRTGQVSPQRASLYPGTSRTTSRRSRRSSRVTSPFMKSRSRALPLRVGSAQLPAILTPLHFASAKEGVGPFFWCLLSCAAPGWDSRTAASSRPSRRHYLFIVSASPATSTTGTSGPTPTAGDAAAYLLNATHLFVASRTASTALCSGLSRTSALPVSSELSRP
jgi:hypothetical protein